ncbi:MAG: hypothetical protein QM589_01105 [Thermomicrobiales bacterium]
MRAHIPPVQADDQANDNGFEPDVIYLSPEEWLVLFERDAQDLLGVSAAEFVQRYRAGEYEDYDPDVMFLSVGISMYDAILAGES